jgi:hypothetical protein
MVKMLPGAGPVNAPIAAAPVTTLVSAEGATLFTGIPVVFVTDIWNVAISPE